MKNRFIQKCGFSETSGIQHKQIHISTRVILTKHLFQEHKQNILKIVTTSPLLRVRIKINGLSTLEG